MPGSIRRQRVRVISSVAGQNPVRGTACQSSRLSQDRGMPNRRSDEHAHGQTAAGTGPTRALAEVHPCCDLANDDRGDDPVDDHAERRPPSRVGHEVGSMLPKVLESVAGQARHEQPG